MTTQSPAIEVQAVSRSYNGVAVVEGVSLSLQAGRITCLLGPSGGGKSTLLRLVAGLEHVDSGEIVRSGDVISRPGFTLPPEMRNIGLVFQDLALFPHLTASQNIAFGLKSQTPEARRMRVAELLEQFRLSHRAGAYPHTLSGGEQQRVAIARALARKPVAVLLDEPFSGLDSRLKDHVRTSVIDGLRAANAAAMIVTHDPEEAMLIADDLVLMAGGRVLQEGAPADCYLQPVSLAAARLLGDAVAFVADIRDGFAHTPFGRLPAPVGSAGQARLIVRPESFVAAVDGVEAQIVSRHFAGALWELVVTLAEQRFRVRLHQEPPAASTIRLRVRVDRTPSYEIVS